jgi:hypothetical protein
VAPPTPNQTVWLPRKLKNTTSRIKTLVNIIGFPFTYKKTEIYTFEKTEKDNF